MEKNLRFPHPNSRETPPIRPQGQKVQGLLTEVWSFSGCWMLEFGVF